MLKVTIYIVLEVSAIISVVFMLMAVRKPKELEIFINEACTNHRTNLFQPIPNSWHHFSRLWKIATLILAAIGFIFLFYGVAVQLLSWMPYDWRGEDDEWEAFSAANGVSGVLAILFIAYLCEVWGTALEFEKIRYYRKCMEGERDELRISKSTKVEIDSTTAGKLALASYRTVEFGQIEIELGELNTHLLQHYKKYDGSYFALITAHNPFLGRYNDTFNEMRQKRLSTEVGERWFYVEAQRIINDKDFIPELALLIFNISKDDALALGRKYQQYTIVYIDESGLAELLACFRHTQGKINTARQKRMSLDT